MYYKKRNDTFAGKFDYYDFQDSPRKKPLTEWYNSIWLYYYCGMIWKRNFPGIQGIERNQKLKITGTGVQKKILFKK
jgi:hypothetical protein